LAGKSARPDALSVLYGVLNGDLRIERRSRLDVRIPPGRDDRKIHT
jgi:hypothetical protein